MLKKNYKQDWVRVACNLEYENLEKLYLELILTSKIPATFISKKNDGNLEFNLEKVNLDRSHSITVVSVGNLG